MFLVGNTIVTLPGVHATQRIAYLDLLNEQRAAAGKPPLTEEEEELELSHSVDLVTDGDTVLIRPDPKRMDLAFMADEILQELFPKENIKFMYLQDERVRNTIRQRGSNWRINPLPRSPVDMKAMILESRIGIGGREIYYHNRTAGSRFLTCQEFAGLGLFSEAERRQLLMEIRDYLPRRNRLGNPEILFFLADKVLTVADFAAHDFAAMPSDQLQLVYERLRQKFFEAVAPELRQDDVNLPEWRNRMYAALIGREEVAVSEEILLGLGAEFYLQVEWLPGGRIEEGELIFESMPDESIDEVSADRRETLFLHEKARAFIVNFIREYGDLEYVNIGRIVGSLSLREPIQGRRSVFLAEVKQHGVDQPFLKIIRIQKWGVAEHLDEGRNLLESMLWSEEYTDYVLNRRLGCRQLGMNLPPRTTARKISERYFGRSREHYGITIYSPYFERDYIHGLATDKISSFKFTHDDYALEFARLLGAAAAANVIVGRSDQNNHVIFDDGDEVLIENKAGMPGEIMIVDHTGTFNDYSGELAEMVPAYAGAINRRLPILKQPAAFTEAFLNAFLDRFLHIQHEYERRQRAFDGLFKHQMPVKANFAYRWLHVLERLSKADPRALREIIRSHVQLK